MLLHGPPRRRNPTLLLVSWLSCCCCSLGRRRRRRRRLLLVTAGATLLLRPLPCMGMGRSYSGAPGAARSRPHDHARARARPVPRHLGPAHLAPGRHAAPRVSHAAASQPASSSSSISSSSSQPAPACALRGPPARILLERPGGLGCGARADISFVRLAQSRERSERAGLGRSALALALGSPFPVSAARCAPARRRRHGVAGADPLAPGANSKASPRSRRQAPWIGDAGRPLQSAPDCVFLEASLLVPDLCSSLRRRR